MGDIQRGAEADPDHDIDGAGGPDNPLDSVNGIRSARYVKAKGNARGSGTVTAGTVAVKEKRHAEQQRVRAVTKRRVEWLDHGMTKKEMVALAATYTGPITKCPTVRLISPNFFQKERLY